jgi:hypothetical protein
MRWGGIAHIIFDFLDAIGRQPTPSATPTATVSAAAS